jgi:hypothetical protein
MNLLNIRNDDCQLDFLSLGSLVHRLDPGVIPFRKAHSVDIHVSGVVSRLVSRVATSPPMAVFCFCSKSTAAWV